MVVCSTIFERSEGRSKIENEMVAYRIIRRLEDEYHVSFSCGGEEFTFLKFMRALLFNMAYIEYRPTLLRLLDEYNINADNVISHFIALQNQKNIPKNVKEMIENSFVTLPYHKQFTHVKMGYVFETHDGRRLEAYQLDKNCHNRRLYELLCKNDFLGMCHEAVEVCSPCLSDVTIVTSMLKSPFTGGYFHSYFKGNQGRDVMDVATNTLFTNGTFDSFFKPIELQQIPSNQLQEYFQTLEDCKEDEKMCKVLRLALSNQRRGL